MRDTPLSFSLLHATYRAGVQAITIRDEWIERSSGSFDIEYVFACNTDDEISMSIPHIALGEAGPSLGKVTAVRNWNWAAANATGQILAVISDDLHPCDDWDLQLSEVIARLDPLHVPFVVNVRDSKSQHSPWISHPIVSRAYYRSFGLWDDEYAGWVVDFEFTMNAHRNGVVLDGLHIVFTHEHPLHGADSTTSHDLMRASAEEGYRVFRRNWPPYKRFLLRRYFHPRPHQVRISRARLLARRSIPWIGLLKAVVPKRIRHRIRELQHGKSTGVAEW